MLLLKKKKNIDYIDKIFNLLEIIVINVASKMTKIYFNVYHVKIIIYVKLAIKRIVKKIKDSMNINITLK